MHDHLPWSFNAMPARVLACARSCSVRPFLDGRRRHGTGPNGARPLPSRGTVQYPTALTFLECAIWRCVQGLPPYYSILQQNTCMCMPDRTGKTLPPINDTCECALGRDICRGWACARHNAALQDRSGSAASDCIDGLLWGPVDHAVDVDSSMAGPADGHGITEGARFGSGRVTELLTPEDPAGDLHKLDTFYVLWASHATELGYSRTDHSAAIRSELTRKRACLAQPSGRSSDDAYQFHRHLATSAHPFN